MTAIKTAPRLDDLGPGVQRWVTEGIISSEQGARILGVEGAAPAVVAPTEMARPRRLSLVAELVSYLGIVLVFASGTLFVNRIWGSIGFAGRLSVGVVVAALGFAAGAAVMRLGDEGATRLGWFMWLVGTGGVGMSTMIVMDRVTGHVSGWALFVTGCAVGAVSVALWRNRERPLQFLTSLVGVGLMAGGLITAMHWHVDQTVGGLVIFAVAVLLGVLGARAVVHPAIVAVLLGQFGAFTGAEAIAGSSRDLGLALGVAAAVAGVTYGLTSKQNAVAGVGVVTFFVMLIRLLSNYMRGPGTLLVAFVLGVALVGAVIWRATRGRAAGLK